MKNFLPILLLSFLLFNCEKAEVKQLEEDIMKIQAYLDENNLTAESTPSGLHYIIEEEGNGAFPNINSTVRVKYRGFHIGSGNTFDQSAEEGVEFPLSGVIEGWQEGIPKFSEGGSGLLLIPSALAYGRQGSGSIGGNAVLVFEVELLEIID